jgi:MFS family permease
MPNMTTVPTGMAAGVESGHAGHTDQVSPGEIAIGVIIGRSSEFFDFFVYAIASVLVFPRFFFPFVDAYTGTIFSFAIFPLAFIARPVGSIVFMTIDRLYGRSAKLAIALFLLGGSTAAIAFLPGYDTLGYGAIALLALFRLGQGFALGGSWDGLASLLALNAPRDRRGWYAMVPQLGAPLGLITASSMFAFFVASLPSEDFLSWGWRFPFFVAFAINVVALFARLRLVESPDFIRLFESRDLQPEPAMVTIREEGRTILIGALAPLASFALFHMVTVFPLSYVMLNTPERPASFLIIETGAAIVGVLAIILSGYMADRFGRRAVLGLFRLCPANAGHGDGGRGGLYDHRLHHPWHQLWPVVGRGGVELFEPAPLYRIGADQRHCVAGGGGFCPADRFAIGHKVRADRIGGLSAVGRGADAGGFVVEPRIGGQSQQCDDHHVGGLKTSQWPRDGVSRGQLMMKVTKAA